MFRFKNGRDSQTRPASKSISKQFLQQLKIKTQAERFFYMFTETPDIKIIISILNSGSDTLIFVLVSYLAKNSSFLGKDLQNFAIIMQTIRSWQFRGFNFIRSNQPPFRQFVSRTIMTAIGVFLKALYENEQTSKQIITYLTQMEPTYFKLLVLKTFIDTIQIIDSEMGYMRYRTMVYSFQDNVIPMICQALMPFFYSIEEGVRISELAFMQSNLKVNEKDFEMQNQTLPITNEQQMQSEYVFMLLKKIIQFNYNITYSQYQSQQAIDTCLITFPDKILEKIINYQFLNALLFIIEKVSDVKVGNSKNKYLQIGLDCLAKMLQSRLGYISQENKVKFLVHAINGLLHMLRKCQQIGSQTLLEGILICNKKLFINVQIKYLKEIINKNEVFRTQNLYQNYLASLTQMIVTITKNSCINTDNNLLLEAVEVANKLIVSFRYQYRDEQEINQQSHFFMAFVKQMTDGFITSLYQPKNIFHGDRVISIPENKLAVSHLFDSFKKAASYNYGYLFGQILKILNFYLSLNKNQMIGFANILFLVSEIIDHNYTDRNVYLTKAKEPQMAVLGVIVQKCTTGIKDYLQSRRISMQARHSYLDIAVIIFTEALMLQFLTSFEGSSGFKIKQKLFLLMVFGQSYNEFFDTEENKSEQTIRLYFIVLFEYVNCQIINNQDEIKMLYALDVMQKCILKLKWGMKRQIFIKSQIFKFLEAQFQNLYIYKTVLDIRSRASKIMVTLTFDDILDQYKFRINKFVNILKTQQMEEVILYDLIGTFQGIETNAISKFFCIRLNQQIDLTNFFIIIFRLIFLKNDQKFAKDVCRLCKLIIINKGLKISNNPIIYHFLKIIIPNVIILLKKINSTPIINYDFWGEAIFELIEMFNGMINGTHINIFMFQHSIASETNNSLSLCKQFMIELCQMITQLSLNIRAYPRLEEAILFFFMSVNKQILNYIYSDETGALSLAYSTNIVGIIDLTVHYIVFLLDGNKMLQEKLIKGIDCLRLFYLFFNKRCKLIHKRVCIENLKRYYELTGNYPIEGGYENKSQKLIFHLISFILTNHKNNNSYLRTITKLIFQLNKNFKQYIIGSFLKLRISPQKQFQVQNILNTKAQEEQQFVQTLKTWIKEFNQFK